VKSAFRVNTTFLKGGIFMGCCSQNTGCSTEAVKEGQNVVTLTSAATTKLLSMMEKEGKQGYALRVGVIPGGCAGFSYDLSFQKTPSNDDIVFDQNGLKVFVSEQSAYLLQAMEIDYIDTLQESGFRFNNPNAKSSCGCGSSFG